MRLTEKINNQLVYDFEKQIEVFDKLGQLEDIEEELGIDLIILKNLIFKGCYIRVKEKNNIKKVSFEHINIPHLQLLRYKSYKLFNVSRYGNYYFQDYGKTWALTKGELEK